MKRIALTLFLGIFPFIVLAAKPGVTCDPRKFGDVVPRECTQPSLAEQQAARDLEAKKAAEHRAAADRNRQDGQLLERYRDETALDAGRIRELDPIRARLVASWRTEWALAGERKQIDSELDFHKPPHPVPPEVQRQVDDNAARFKAQRDLNTIIEADIAAVNAKFEDLRVRMRPLWAARKMK